MLYTKIMNDNKDFLTLYKKGRYAASKYSVIYVRPNGRPFNRLGITAGKKVGNAVCRNRAKRLIRLAYRQSEVDMPVGMDIVIVARTAITTIKSQEYCGYMEKYGIADINKMFRSFSSSSTLYSIRPITVSAPTMSEDDCTPLSLRGAKITSSGAFSGGTSLSTFGLETTQPVITKKSEKANRMKSTNLLIFIAS